MQCLPGTHLYLKKKYLVTLVGKSRGSSVSAKAHLLEEELVRTSVQVLTNSSRERANRIT